MLRSLMYDDHTDDANKEAAFIAMMHDFVATHENVPASTESFKAIAEKHMSKQLDLQHNGRLDWFFSEWVYGTELPKYDFKYEIQPAVGGKVKLHITLTQSQVDEHFAMFVPVFADFGHGMQRLGQIPIAGSSTRTMDYILPAQPKKVALNYFKDVLER
jgi:aminopeptidase N